MEQDPTRGEVIMAVYEPKDCGKRVQKNYWRNSSFKV